MFAPCLSQDVPHQILLKSVDVLQLFKKQKHSKFFWDTEYIVYMLLFHCYLIWIWNFLPNFHYYNEKALGETQTLRAGRSNTEPKIFALPQTPFPGAQDGQNLISWR